ncbi:hypothetical protein AVEN_226287-1 [Araneus ventricosus]|uniref:Uncharacterized protein n=1 Tax=Araneus ventricosus TaxID=182803 RepID=A0A4Y2DBP7_ARAVE|nr:hypothetical protein AVEN_226287-1 [Araneus ventricosus]
MAAAQFVKKLSSRGPLVFGQDARDYQSPMSYLGLDETAHRFRFHTVLIASYARAFDRDGPNDHLPPNYLFLQSFCFGRRKVYCSLALIGKIWETAEIFSARNSQFV